MSFFSFQDIIACTTGIMILVTLMLVLELTARREGADPAPEAAHLGAAETELVRGQHERDDLLRRVAEMRALLAALAEGPTVTAKQIEELRREAGTLRRANEDAAREVARAQAEKDRAAERLARTKERVAAIEKDIEALERKIEHERRKVRVTLLRGDRSAKTPLFVECGLDRLAVARIADDGIPQAVQSFAGADPTAAFLAWARTRSREKEQFVLLVRPDAVERFEEVIEGLRALAGFDVGWDVWPPSKTLFPGP